MLQKITDLLSSNPYPGRGIIIGKDPDGDTRILYFIMGRSSNSRNRVFERTEDGIRTAPFDPEKVEDPSLIIYHPVRFATADRRRFAIVTNGSQTDIIRDAVLGGCRCIGEALKTSEYEPDYPNLTPRISGIVYDDGSVELSILKSDQGDRRCCRYTFGYDNMKDGTGRFISTYKHDGSPVPSFEGEPIAVSLDSTLDDYADAVWNALNNDNKVSLYACNLRKNGQRTEKIYNKHGERTITWTSSC